MPPPKGLLICVGLLLTAGGALAVCFGLPFHSSSLFGVLLLLELGAIVGGVGLLVCGLCMAMKNLQGSVPGHSLLHPRTGTRFSPQQALAIQRRLDRIRREMSEDSVSGRAEPEPSLPSTPPPWTMEPPPSYDTVMKQEETAAGGCPDICQTEPQRVPLTCVV
ncbi:uncharacterized protein si:dkeyp-51f12.3 [Notolabrus celidotus]|uniref:uncharacterized protein si:dkeyp-51f12.3 n=1 Tax=Notolabrus celidotus TaxID=1203425 RepID=UPI0014901969|nr:uncharacterized protein si:dkeyp-51f12.3 [Notolabrus celidotus]